MDNAKLPPKPGVAMPRVRDARNAHKGRSKKQIERSLYNRFDNEEQNQQRWWSPLPPYESRLQQKRKAHDNEDNNTSQTPSKRLKANTSTFNAASPSYALAPDALGNLPMPLKHFIPLLNKALSRKTSYQLPSLTAPPPFLRWDRTERRFLVTDAVQLASSSAQITAFPTNDNAPAQKRKRPETEGVSREEVQRGLKRLKVNLNAEDGEPATNTGNRDTLANQRRTKRHAQRPKKAQSETSMNMRLQDLIPHYIPASPSFAQARTKESKMLRKVPKKFMDLPTEIRQNIWDKVFEDEAYKFTVKKNSKCSQASDMIPSPPPSFKCLFIHPSLAGEVAEQMYKSMRVEINFGRLRPCATRNFMKQMGNTRLGREAHRIFFFRALSLHKVNVGVFPNAREIVSTNWTVYGNKKMDEEDYLNHYIDPEDVLEAPPSAPPKQKGLKERRFWKNQKTASQRYKRHIEGWCHTEAENPKQTMQVPDPYDPKSMIDMPVKVHRRPCPFQDKCLNLKNTKFCMEVKYKFGCIKGRHSRHKEAMFDFYPESERIEQPRPPKSKFYKKGGN